MIKINVKLNKLHSQFVHSWVTVFGWVKHLSAEPGTQAYSAWACPLWQTRMTTWRKLGEAYRVIHQPVFMVSQCLLMPGWWLA